MLKATAVSATQDEVPAAKTLLVAIPCLNEAQTIGNVIANLPRQIPGIARVDIIVVDDGSTDGTADLARKAGAYVLRHPHNRGLSIAFQSAVSYAVQHGYDLMMNVDGDGQFSTADAPKLVEPVLRGKADMVTASRFKDASRIPDMPRTKLVGNRMMSYLISRLIGRIYRDVSCGFRCYSREALLNINLHGRFTYTQETFLDLSQKDIRIEEISVDVQYFPERRVARRVQAHALCHSNIFDHLSVVPRLFSTEIFLLASCPVRGSRNDYGARFWLSFPVNRPVLRHAVCRVQLRLLLHDRRDVPCVGRRHGHA